MLTKTRSRPENMARQKREIRIGENRFLLGEDKIVHVTVVGELDEEMTSRFKEAVLKLGNLAKGKIKVLIDISRAGKVSSGARKALVKLNDYSESIGKTALFGAHPVARVLASFILGLSQKEKARFFKTRQEALDWLGK